MNDTPWTREEMTELLGFISQDKDNMKKRFIVQRISSLLNWADVKIESRSPDACMKAFQHIISWVHKHISVEELITMGLKKLDGKYPIEMVPNAPKKPMTAYFQYVHDQYAEAHKKNPELSIIDFSKDATDSWKDLAPTKKEKYFQAYLSDKAEYDAAMQPYVHKCKKMEKQVKKEKLEKKAMDKHLAKREGADRITPFELFWERVYPTSSRKAAREKFGNLPDSGVVNWIWTAVSECKHPTLANGETSPAVHLKLKEPEKRLLLQSENIYEKPSKMLYNFFKSKVKDSKKSVADLNKRYRALSVVELRVLMEDHAADLAMYCTRLLQYMEKREGTLSVEEKFEYELLERTYQSFERKASASLQKFLAKNASKEYGSVDTPEMATKKKVNEEPLAAKKKKKAKVIKSEEGVIEENSGLDNNAAAKSNKKKKRKANALDSSLSSSLESQSQPPSKKAFVVKDEITPQSKKKRKSKGSNDTDTSSILSPTKGSSETDSSSVSSPTKSYRIDSDIDFKTPVGNKKKKKKKPKKESNDQ